MCHQVCWLCVEYEEVPLQSCRLPRWPAHDDHVCGDCAQDAHGDRDGDQAEAGIGTRALQLMDSQVCLGALAKGRSPSPKLSTMMERIAGLSLKGVIVQSLGYVSTLFNPADAGSRRHGP